MQICVCKGLYVLYLYAVILSNKTNNQNEAKQHETKTEQQHKTIENKIYICF